MPKVTVLQHEASETLGTIEEALVVRGITPRTILTYAGEAIPKKMQGMAGLIVLGGPMGVRDVDQFPYLAQEMTLIADAVAQGLPVLGVCLGAQMLAHTLGAEVKANSRQEIGWYPTCLTDAAHEDPLWTNIDSPQMVFHWHSDIFDVPQNAVSLAYSEMTPCQAFRYGTNAYGLQCHLELTPRMMELWAIEFADSLKKADLTSDDVRVPARDFLPGMQAMARTIFGRWADLIAA